MFRRLMLALAICVPLTACQTLQGGGGEDKYSTAALKENLKVGVTTPEEVRQIYGKPNYTSDGPNGPSMWSYDVDDGGDLLSTAFNFVGIPSEAKSLTNPEGQRSLSVHFDNYRVSSYSISASHSK